MGVQLIRWGREFDKLGLYNSDLRVTFQKKKPMLILDLGAFLHSYVRGLDISGSKKVILLGVTAFKLNSDKWENKPSF